MYEFIASLLLLTASPAAPQSPQPTPTVTPAPAPTPAVSPAAPVYVALGDSITAGAYGSTYTIPLAQALGARLINLGKGGEFSGPMHYQLSCKGCAHLDYDGLLADEVPKIPLDATLVTLYVGTNDMWVAGDRSGDILANYDAAARAYDSNIRAIVKAVRLRVPGARIVVATVPNGAHRPAAHAWSPILRQGETNLANSMKQTLISTGLPIVDLECEPGMYDDANFGGPIDPHPNAKGFAIIAADFLSVIQHAPPVSHCDYENP